MHRPASARVSSGHSGSRSAAQPKSTPRPARARSSKSYFPIRRRLRRKQLVAKIDEPRGCLFGGLGAAIGVVLHEVSALFARKFDRDVQAPPEILFGKGISGKHLAKLGHDRVVMTVVAEIAHQM